MRQQSSLNESPAPLGDSNPARFGTFSMYRKVFSRFAQCSFCGAFGDCDNRLLFVEVMLHPLVRRCISCHAGYASLEFVRDA